LDLDNLIRRFERARAGRSNFETTWQEIAERVLPQMSDFTSKRSPGEKRTEYMYDATAALAAQKAVSAISAFAWPSNQRYQKLTTDNPALNKSNRVKTYFDEVTDRLFRARYSPRAAFESQMGEAGMQFMVFGTGLVFIDDNIGTALRYKAMHLAQTYLTESAGGTVDTIYRCWSWSLRQIEQRWPGKLPPDLAAKLQQYPDHEVEVAHCVMPRTDYDPGWLGYRGWPWASVYFLPGQRSVLDEGGYRSWPFAVMRYMTSTGEVYGRSPAWLALTNIKVLNTMKRSILQAAQKAVDPPLLASEDGVLGAFSQVPGALNFGGLGSNGEELVKPLHTGAKVELGLEMMDKEREIIGSAFLMDVFRVLIENPQMTATQTLELLNERATIMSPIVGRIESEGLGPMTEREIEILATAGQLPEMPPELIEAQGEYKIEYTSPMRKAMRASEAVAINRTLESVLPMAEVDPSVLDPFDLPEMAREIAEIMGVPAKCIRDAEAIKARQEERAGQQETAQMLEAAPLVTQAAANLGKMQAAGGLQPGM
jgi:hypothetical protein